MATVLWSGSTEKPPPSTRSVSLAQGDDSAWLTMNGSCEIAVDGGSAFDIEIYRSYTAADDAASDDNILVDTQDETERAARYDFVGSGSIRILATAVTGGPITVYVTR